MPSARARFGRRRNTAVADRHDAPTTLPQRWSGQRLGIAAIALTAVAGMLSGAGPASAGHADAHRGRAVKPQGHASVSPGALATGSVDPVTGLLGGLLGGGFAEAILGSLPGPGAGPRSTASPAAAPLPAAKAAPGPATGLAPVAAATAPPGAAQPSPVVAQSAAPVAAPVLASLPAPAVPPPAPPAPPPRIPNPAPTRAPAKPPADPLSGIERGLLNLVNADRARAGLPALKLEVALVATARAHSAGMRDAARLFHTEPLASAIPVRWRLIGENVGMGWSADVMHDQFMQSGPHCANILGRFDRIGIGVATGAGHIWVTQYFVR